MRPHPKRPAHRVPWLGAAAWCRPLVLASLSLGWLAGAVAQEPRLATKDEYLACLRAQSSIEARQARLQARDLAFQQRAARFQAAGADLAAQVKQHPPTTQRSWASYNQAIAARNASAAELNQAATAMQQEQASLNQQILETNARCGTLMVSAEDARAAEAAHRQAASAP